MEHLHDFIESVFKIKSKDERKKEGLNSVSSEDSDWIKLCKKAGDASQMFYKKYIDADSIDYKGSLGQQKRAYVEVPYFAFLDKSTHQKIKSGVYVVYLLSADRKKIYLSLAVGVSDQKGEISAEDWTEEIRKTVKSRKFQNRLPDDAWIGNTETSKKYLQAIAFYKDYNVDDIPSNEELETDFFDMLALYREYLNHWQENTGTDSDHSTDGGESIISVSEDIAQIESCITRQGFSFEDHLIKNYYLSLKSKPFVILAGTSGTGKTKLVKLFADAIGAEYVLVPVRPDWSDGSDLFGFSDLNGNFRKGPVCEAFEKCINNPDKPVFLCLDEMNLARVEYYFSDFLSIMETREKDDEGRIKTGAIAEYEDGIPDNLYIVGTVNMDETTFPFSKKVLDRANTIEFDYVNLKAFREGEFDSTEPLTLDNSFLRMEYLNLELDCMETEEDKTFIQEICEELYDINERLNLANSQIGYRVRDEICFYMLNNRKTGLLDRDVAMDFEIIQKILPRIHGSSVVIRGLLISLFEFCMKTTDDTLYNTPIESMKRLVNSADGSLKYPLSARKLFYMMLRYENDGFTAYWL